MKHVGDDELILYCYNEPHLGHRIEAHLRACADCAKELRRMQLLLSLLRLPTPPERAEDYGSSVWRTIHHRLPQRSTHGAFYWFTWRQAGFASGLIAAVFLAFMVGRMTHNGDAAAPRAHWDGSPPGNSAFLVTVGDHLESAQMLMTELANGDAAGRTDISAERARAREVVLANRLYRHAAERNGMGALEELLTELERTLVEIANGPSTLSDMHRKQWLDAIQLPGILLKVRIAEESLRQRAIPLGNPSARRA